MDKDCELQKIATFRSYLEANVNAQFTFLAGGLIGILVLAITLFYEGVFDVFGGRFLDLSHLLLFSSEYSTRSAVYLGLSRTNKPDTFH